MVVTAFSLHCRLTGMPRPASLSPERILDAAERLLRRRGATALSMRALATALGVDPMAPYRYFESRDAVVAALAERRVGAGLDAAMGKQGRWRTRLEALALAYWRGVAGQPELVLALTARSEASATLAVRWLDGAQRAMADTGLPRRAQREMADAMVDLVHGAALAPVAASERAVRRSIALLLDGVEARLGSVQLRTQDLDSKLRATRTAG